MFEDLKELFSEKGRKIASGARMRLPLNQSSYLYWIEKGDIDIQMTLPNTLPPQSCITLEAEEAFWGLQQETARREEPTPLSSPSPKELDATIKAGAEHFKNQKVIIHVRKGPKAEQDKRLELSKGALIIGSGERADLVLSDTAISRQHAELSLTPEGVRVRDMGSTNGIYHQGNKITEIIVQTNTTLHIGICEIDILPQNVTKTPPQSDIELHALLFPGTIIYQIPILEISQWLKQSADNIQIFTPYIETWISKWGAILAPPPFSQKSTTMLDANMNVEVDAQEIAQSTNFNWLQISSGQASYNIADKANLTWLTWYPLAPGDWLRCLEPSTFKSIDTKQYLNLDPDLHGLREYHRLLTTNLITVYKKRQKRQSERIAEQEQDDGQLVVDAFKELENAIKTRATTSFYNLLTNEEDDFLPAIQKVAQAAISPSMQCQNVSHQKSQTSLNNKIVSFGTKNGFRTSMIELEDTWWQNASTPLLGVLATNGKAVALLPNRAGRYEMWSPASGKKVALDAQSAGDLAPVAWQFFRPFPDKELKVIDLITFAFKRLWKDLRSLLIFSFIAGTLGLLTPICTGILVDKLIPSGEMSSIGLLALALAVLAITTSVISITNAHLTLKLSMYMQHSLDSALWDKLLRMPLPFFRTYSVGDLMLRIRSVTQTAEELSSLTIAVGLTSLTSLLHGVLLFYYSLPLALSILVIAFGFMFIELGFALWNIRHQRRALELDGKINGFITRILKGISKIKAAGVQNRVFGLWATDYTQLRQTIISTQKIHLRAGFFRGFTPTIATMALFWATMQLDNPLTTGEFVAFNAAFGTFLGGLLSLNGLLPSLLQFVPTLERIKPILETRIIPEKDLADMGTLLGKIEIDNLTFRYQKDSPYILKDIQMNIKPGEFVAFVGPSGSGKSTFLRLLLGLEKPSSGTVLYDGRDITQISIKGLRKQLGVVLQSGRLLPGSILQNICGANQLSMEQAWLLAEKASIADDIEAMPMGMHTNLTHGDALLSGGQKQRLLIARAIAGKPKVILFDEATSALDNQSQARVMRNIEALRATRIMVAHRLSTVVKANRIFVFNEGKIVQSGTYKELYAQEGLFRELAQNQNIDAMV
jgi:ATP-binding cassette subfamily C protein